MKKCFNKFIKNLSDNKICINEKNLLYYKV